MINKEITEKKDKNKNMDKMQEKILSLLARRGPLSHAQLYQSLSRYRAKIKNETIDKLMQAGLISQEMIKLSPKTKKPARFLSLTRFGHDFIIKMSKDKNL